MDDSGGSDADEDWAAAVVTMAPPLTRRRTRSRSTLRATAGLSLESLLVGYLDVKNEHADTPPADSPLRSRLLSQLFAAPILTRHRRRL